MNGFLRYAQEEENTESSEIELDFKKLKRNANKNIEFARIGYVGKKKKRRFTLTNFQVGEYEFSVTCLRGGFLMDLSLFNGNNTGKNSEGFHSNLKKILEEGETHTQRIKIAEYDLPTKIEFFLTKFITKEMKETNDKRFSKFDIRFEYFDDFVLPNYWQLGNFLNQGGQGEIFTGLNERNGKMIAIKKILVEDLQDEDAFALIENEINLLKKLNHKHIVKYLGFEKKGEEIYCFLDLISGGSLSDFIASFSFRESLLQNYIKQILKGIQYLHNNNIIHRDIKPGNVLIGKNGHLYVADFGESIQIKTKKKKEEIIKGTACFLSPEIISDNLYSKASDIWALGSTFYAMITGYPVLIDVFKEFEYDGYKFIDHLKENPGVFKERISIPSTLPDDLRDFLGRCLEVDHEKRITVEELVNHKWIKKQILSKDDAVLFSREDLKRNKKNDVLTDDEEEESDSDDDTVVMKS